MPGVAERQRERAVATHGVTADGAPRADREVRLDERRQLVDDVALHAKVRRPRRLGGVEVEARALPEVVAFGIGHALAARAGVGRDDHHAVLGGIALRAGLGDEVLLAAGQA